MFEGVPVLDCSYFEYRMQPLLSLQVKDNLTVMSIAFLLDNRNDAVIWRGARKAAMIKQFLGDVDWGQVTVMHSQEYLGGGGIF